MNKTPSIITDDGDIVMHGREGARVMLEFQDENGNPRDLAGATLMFEALLTSGPLRIALVPTGLGTADLIIPRGAFAEMVGKKGPFVLMEESLPEAPILWQGDFVINGWAGA